MTNTAEILLDEIGLGAAPKRAEYSRDLTEEDLKLAAVRADYGSKPNQSIIRKLRFPHHTLARLLAEGKKHPECSAITGYAIGTIVILEKDPAFCELVSFYKAQIGEKYLDVHERLATLGTTAAEILQERLEEKPESITTRELKEIVESTFDRSIAPSKVNGQAPGGSASNLVPQINIHFGPPAPKAIEHEPMKLLENPNAE